MKKLFGISLLAIVCFAPGLVSAQGFAGITDALAPTNTLVVDPAYPEPGQVVNARIDDYSGGVFGSEITWQYDGEVVPNSANQRSVNIQAGALGSTGQIEAILTLPSGGTQVLTAEINPVYLDVIIEPQTRVPSWYAGRAMPSIGSQINVTALVNDGTMVNPAGLVYTWEVNQRVLDAGPVRGRNKMSFQTPRGQDFILSVTVSRSTGGVLASKAMRVNSVSPMLAFYEQHSLYGSRQYPISASLPVIGNTIKVEAEPFFLDTRVYNNPDVAVWEVNGLETDNAARNPYEITLQRGAVSSRTSVNFHVRSLQEVLQGGEETITLNF